MQRDVSALKQARCRAVPSARPPKFPRATFSQHFSCPAVFGKHWPITLHPCSVAFFQNVTSLNLASFPHHNAFEIHPCYISTCAQACHSDPRSQLNGCQDREEAAQAGCTSQQPSAYWSESRWHTRETHRGLENFTPKGTLPARVKRERGQNKRRLLNSLLEFLHAGDQAHKTRQLKIPVCALVQVKGRITLEVRRLAQRPEPADPEGYSWDLKLDEVCPAGFQNCVKLMTPFFFHFLPFCFFL